MKQMAAVGRRLAPGVLLVGLLSCKAPGGPGSEPFGFPTSTDGGAGQEVSVGTQALCLPASAEALPGRIIATPDQGLASVSVEREVFVTDLFARFRTSCGGCHVENTTGGFHTDRPTFTKLDFDGMHGVKRAIESDDPARFMPPPPVGKPWSQRDRSEGTLDPVVQLDRELAQWLAQGKPDDVYRVKVDQTTASDSYAVPEEMAQRQTNVGNCIPQRGMIGTLKQDMEDLDAKFGAMSSFADLPKTLAETDLTTLDSAVLARKGVVSFAPNYPLWSEDAGKMRMVRVPHGTSIKLNKETQKFEIPDNTRFYKTFLKKITQRDGKEVWKKIETRLIVTRPDTQDGDMPPQQHAIFASYAWNEEETEARLVEDGLRNGEPFADRLFTYVVDEIRYDQVVAGLMAKTGKTTGLEKELAKDENKGIVRHYMIPGKQRCIECHQGSPMADFVLGFTPLQIRRRPKGEAGTYEESGPDELNQLQRLIDYGLIAGISSPSDVRGLEMPQGPPDKLRPYRNKHELLAQAYLLGNCSHCHNPRGFPSVKSPELVDMLDFLPSQRASGGIFQFPLDRVSPLRRRGRAQDIDIPYITPSLRDYPAGTAGAVAKAEDLLGLWTLKWVDCKLGALGAGFCDAFNDDAVGFIAAPWRSLIYRNIDTPYIYADDFTVFPHMPRHSMGFDCRAPRIMGDWMVSIPAVHKEEGAAYENNVRAEPFDQTAQPYVEVKSTDPGYMVALAATADRLYQYHTGKRYDYCPDRRDIVIPEALITTDPAKLIPPDTIQYTDSTRKKVIMPNDGVPDRAHAVPSDTTDVPGDWLPRRGDFRDDPTDLTKHDGVLTSPKPSEQAYQISIPVVLRDFHVTQELCELAIEKEIPFGVWKKKDGCDLSSAPRADSFTGADRLNWMDHAVPQLTTDAPIYSITPGGGIFGNICVNCHGPKADSKGLLAEAISEMTGGAARVANLRDGLLGPPDKPGGNIARIFDADQLNGLVKDTSFSDVDWAARYVSWMALGGTQRVLPASILKIIGATRVMGLSRGQGVGFVQTATPNMLELAKNACNDVLAWDSGTPFLTEYFNGGHPDATKAHTSLLWKIGDAEMWQRVCSIGNRPVVRVPRWDGSQKDWLLYWDSSFYWGDDYGEHPVMNERGGIDPRIEKNNLMPTCIAEADLAPSGNEPPPPPPKTPEGRPIPTCPPSLLEEIIENGFPAKKNALKVVPGTGDTKNFVGRDEWGARGAANAGTAVLLYLSQVRDGVITPKPAYDRCEQLNPKTMKLPRPGVCAELLKRK
jgi:hypothetical protein